MANFPECFDNEMEAMPSYVSSLAEQMKRMGAAMTLVHGDANGQRHV